MASLIKNYPAHIRLSKNALVLSIRAQSAQEIKSLIERIQELADQIFDMILIISENNTKQMSLSMLNKAKIIYRNNTTGLPEFSQKLHPKPGPQQAPGLQNNHLILSNVPDDFCTNMPSTPTACSLEIVMIDPAATQTEESFLLKPPDTLIAKIKAFFEKNIKLISKVVIALFVLLASLLSPTIRSIPLRIHESIRRKTS